MDELICSSPGKIVLCGEYAVLHGAPAIVAALDLRVIVRVRLSNSSHWICTSSIYPTAYIDPVKLRSVTHDVNVQPQLGKLLHCVLSVLPIQIFDALPPNLSLDIDSSALYLGHAKLGVGSSAACIVALLATLLSLSSSIHFDLNKLKDRHYLHQLSYQANTNFQQRLGSGLDIAASIYGGTIIYNKDTPFSVKTFTLPSELFIAFYFVGNSASTTTLLAKYKQWLELQKDNAIVETLKCTAAHLASVPNPVAGRYFDLFSKFSDSLLALDKVSGLGIFSKEHLLMHNLSTSLDLVYKTCGAGGGDVGMGLSMDKAILSKFSEKVKNSLNIAELKASLDNLGVCIHGA